ncbi:uncharacterized protein [Epargyreus clarus]|uniref:uncharacterized protein n=1 Tax=Epargyreus clarus TaxID=520877 RepID=UPI003C2FB6F8
MTSGGNLKPMTIDLNIGDQLTTISCGHIVAELIKFIAYQRLQIPYTYQWLKQVINKKKESPEKKDSFQSERHFRVASNALENLDFILKSLLKEIDGASIPSEVCVALGATPITCREMYRFLLPSMCHKPQCHSTNIANDQKIQRSVFKTLVTSESLSKVFFDTISPTNMYIYLKKKVSSNQDVVCGDSFVYISGCRIPRSAKIVVLDFSTPNKESLSCCNDLQVFGDVISEDLDKLKLQESAIHNFDEIESNDSATWFQSSYVMKGFKDCIVNGISVTNAWLES